MQNQLRVIESESYARYIRALLLALFLCLALGAGSVIASDDSAADSTSGPSSTFQPHPVDRSIGDLPEIEGFTWQYIDSIGGYFCLPEDWYYLPVEFAGLREYFFTEENLAERSLYQTGLSVEVITGATRKLGQTAERYAFSHIAQMVSNGDTIMTWGPILEPYRNYGCRSRVIGADSTELTVLTQTVANTKTETVYIMIFMAPTAAWEEVEEIATTMMGYFILDEHR